MAQIQLVQVQRKSVKCSATGAIPTSHPLPQGSGTTVEKGPEVREDQGETVTPGHDRTDAA